MGLTKRMLEEAQEAAWNEYLDGYSDEEQEEIREYGFTLRVRWEDWNASDVRDEARRRAIEVVADAAREHGDPAMPIQLVSVVTGAPGEFGGLNTASDIILRGLSAADSIATFALLAPGPSLPIPRSNAVHSDVELVTLGSKRQFEVLQNGVPTWLLGHGGVTGRLAQFLASDWGCRRAHFVHVDPFQVEMARRTMLDGSANARTKAMSEQDLLASADARIFIGNSAEAYRRWADVPGSLSNFALGMSATDSVPLPGRNPIQVMMFGRLDDAEVKGVDVLDRLIRDEALLRWRSADGGRIEFMAVGAHADDIRIREWAGRCAVHPMVSRRELHELLLPQASVVIHPSNADSFGLSALEALAMGRPTLVSESAGIAMFYKDFGRSDWVLPARLEADPDKWVQRIKKLTASASAWRSASGQAIALTKRITATASDDIERLLRLLQTPVGTAP